MLRRMHHARMNRLRTGLESSREPPPENCRSLRSTARPPRSMLWCQGQSPSPVRGQDETLRTLACRSIHGLLRVGGVLVELSVGEVVEIRFRTHPAQQLPHNHPAGKQTVSRWPTASACPGDAFGCTASGRYLPLSSRIGGFLLIGGSPGSEIPPILAGPQRMLRSATSRMRDPSAIRVMKTITWQQQALGGPLCDDGDHP